MNSSYSMFGFAATLALVTAVLFVTGAVVADFSVIPLATGIVWLLFAAGLNARQRWLAYFAFLLAIAGVITIYATSASGGLPQWMNLSIAAVNLLLAFVLFFMIWRHPLKAT